MGLLDRIGGGFSEAAEAWKRAAEGTAERLTQAATGAVDVVRDHARTSNAAAQLRGLREGLTSRLTAAMNSAQARDGGVDSNGQIGWLKRAGSQPPTRDVSARFDQLLGSAKAGDRALPPDADKYVYLTVPGVFTERYPGYFDANEGRLRELGLDARRVPIDTDASVEANARVVRDAILEASKSGKQVVVLGHSKGGVDTAAALALYPELKPHVRAFVAMQAPYGGSPIANDASSCPTLLPKVEGFIKNLFRGDPASLADLSYARRKDFIAKHPLPGGIPTVSLATSHGGGPSLTAAPGAYIRTRYNEASDGVVAQKDAEIPGSSVVRLSDMDHAMSAMQGPGAACKYNPGDVTQALVTLALTTPPSP